jgi:hypothetical protein
MATMVKEVQVLARSNSSSTDHDDKDEHRLDLDFATHNNNNKSNLEEEIVFEEEEEDIEQARKKTTPATSSSLTFAVVDATSRYTERTCLCFLGYGTCCAIVSILGCITFICLLLLLILYLAGTDWVEKLN